MGTILCMSQMWFPQEKPSNQRKTRRQLCRSSKKKPSRQRATARFSVLHKRKGTLFGLMVHASQCLHGSNSAARTNCADGRVLRKLPTTKWIQNGSDAGPESFEYFEIKVFCRARGRSNIDWVQRGAFKRDSIRDFALRLP